MAAVSAPSSVTSTTAGRHSIIASSENNTLVEEETFPAVISETTTSNNNSNESHNSAGGPLSPGRLLAAASAYVPRPQLSQNLQDQSRGRALASSVQQAPVIIRKKAASFVSKISTIGTQVRRVGNASGLVAAAGQASHSSRRNTYRPSSSRSALSSVSATEEQHPPQTGQIAPCVIATSNSTATEQQQPPSPNMSAPPRYKALDGGKAWGASWRRFRTASPSATSCPTQSPSFSTVNESSEFQDQSDSEHIIFFDSMSLLSPSASTLMDERAAVTMSQQQPQNVLQWLNTSCPTDVLPHILAYCGPQMTSRLRRVNKFWCRTVEKESTWRVLCQDLYKWKSGDEEPPSWKEFYINNPCVPVDFKSISSLLKHHPEQNVSIWLRPGRYYLKETLQVGSSPHQKLSIATMQLPDNIFHTPLDMAETPVGMELPNQRKKRKSPAFLKFILCTAAAYHEGAVDDESLASEMSEADNSNSPLDMAFPQRPTRATLIMRTRKQNEPAIRVSAGQFTATNLNIEHSSAGTDIWHGNAAIQVQPELDAEGPPPLLRRDLLPVAHLSGLRVTSRTGRGIVTIDGSQLHCERTRVYDCAATGIYIGGRGTRARVEQTDVLRNGLGSRGTSRRNAGISRGHSGVYLEQGIADIVDCNVSNNTLTGITAVSNENSTLNLSESELVGNGSFQLEIPAQISRGVNMRQNRLEAQGTGRIRALLAPH